MEKKNPLSSMMQEAMEKVRTMVDTNTIVGDPIQGSAGTTIIPISKVSVGFAGGGNVGAANIVTPIGGFVDEHKKPSLLTFSACQ